MFPTLRVPALAEFTTSHCHCHWHLHRGTYWWVASERTEGKGRRLRDFLYALSFRSFPSHPFIQASPGSVTLCTTMLTSRFRLHWFQTEGMEKIRRENHCWFRGASDSGILLWSTCCCLLFRVLGELGHEFCSGFIAAFNEVKLLTSSWVNSILPGIGTL